MLHNFVKDADGSGSIEPDEFKAMLKEIGHEFLELSRIKHMMKRINTLAKETSLCQAWDLQHPHVHVRNTPETNPKDGLDGNNYCRNPDPNSDLHGIKSGIWCLTTDPTVLFLTINQHYKTNQCYILV